MVAFVSIRRGEKRDRREGREEKKRKRGRVWKGGGEGRGIVDFCFQEVAKLER